MNFAEIQKQEQEQERRAREVALAAQQLVTIPSSAHVLFSSVLSG